MGIVNDFFNPNMLALAGGVVVGNVGTQMIMNRLLTAGANGQRPFDLPLVNYATPAGQFYAQNAWILAGYKLVIGIGASWLLKNQSPRLSNGIAIGTVAGAISDVLKTTGVLANVGVGRYFPSRGTGAYVPGVPSIFTGPAGQFLNGGAPQPGRGTGAIVNRSFMNRAAAASPNPFSS